MIIKYLLLDCADATKVISCLCNRVAHKQGEKHGVVLKTTTLWNKELKNKFQIIFIRIGLNVVHSLSFSSCFSLKRQFVLTNVSSIKLNKIYYNII